ncbi:hypothetical protein LCM17_22665 [Cereibacter sphaeroides]|nr:hypothetical protein [Cereibacter sphaeroides]
MSRIAKASFRFFSRIRWRERRQAPECDAQGHRLPKNPAGKEKLRLIDEKRLYALSGAGQA